MWIREVRTPPARAMLHYLPIRAHTTLHSVPQKLFTKYKFYIYFREHPGPALKSVQSKSELVQLSY